MSPLLFSAVFTGIGIFALKYLVLYEQLEEKKKFDEYEEKKKREDKETE
jgi:hypothetical protein